MSYNGSGTFVINSTGQPVVTGTVISSSTFNSLTADLGTGLSTAITKDGQTTTTAKIPFALGISAAVASNFAAGTVAAPSIYLSTDTGTGFYRIGANNNGYAVSGTKLLDFSSALFAVTGAATVSTTLGVSGLATFASMLANGAEPKFANSALNMFLYGGTVGSPIISFSRYDTVAANRGAKIQYDFVGAATSESGGISFYTSNDTSGATGLVSRLSVSAAGAVTIPGTLGVTGAVTLAGATASAWTTYAPIQAALPAISGNTEFLLGSNVYYDGAFKYVGARTASSIILGSATGAAAKLITMNVTATTGTANGAITFVEALSITKDGAVTIPGTLGVTGTITPGQTTGIVGTNALNDAQVGSVGESIMSSITSVTNYPATGTWGDLTSISLTAGDWDIAAMTQQTTPGTMTGESRLGISTTSGNSVSGLVTGYNRITFLNATVSSDSGGSIPMWRLQLGSTTTVYLKFYADYSTGTPKAMGTIIARRRR